MKALLIATTPPDGTSSCQTGSTNWTLRMCKVLHQEHEITLVTTQTAKEPWFLEASIPIIEHEPTPRNRFSRILSSIMHGIYPSIWTLYSQDTSRYLRNLTSEAFDVCWLLDDYAGLYLRDIPQYLPTVFVRHYLFGMQDSFKPGQGLVSFLQGLFHRHTAIAYERWTTKRANIVTFGTEESCKFLRSIYPSNRIEYLPTKPFKRPIPTNVKNVNSPKGPNNRLIAAYLGDMSFVRNADGVRWFLKDVLSVMPEVLRKKYHFQFIGLKPDPVPQLDSLPSGSSVEFLGFVPDLTACLHRAQVGFIPVFGGNGIRLKTLTLLGSALPTISTPDALEGLDLEDGENILKASSSNDFLRAFEKLLEPEFRKAISLNSLDSMDKFLGEDEDALKVLELSSSIVQSK